MKKQAYTYVVYPLVIVLIILVLPLLKSNPEHNLDSMLFVKAVFLDKADGDYTLTLYATDAESGDGHLFEGSGKNIDLAIENAKNGAYKNLFFPSAELMILGDYIQKEEFLSLSEYAVKTSSFPLSVSVFKGKKDFASAEYIKITDAYKARNISGDTRLWKYANELFSESKTPSFLTIEKDGEGKINFKERKDGTQA